MFMDWLQVGLGIAQIAAPIVRQVEDPSKTGDQKKQAAIGLILPIAIGAINAVATAPDGTFTEEQKLLNIIEPIVNNTVAVLNQSGEFTHAGTNAK